MNKQTIVEGKRIKKHKKMMVDEIGRVNTPAHYPSTPTENTFVSLQLL